LKVAVFSVLFVDHAEAMGGAEYSLLMLMQNLDQATWQPHLATTNGRFLQAAQQAHIPTHPIAFPRLRRSPRFPLDWLAGAQAIANVAQQVNTDFLHANTIRAALYTALAAKIVKRPFIWHMRDFWLSENKPTRVWLDTLGKRLLIAAATRVIVNSAATAAHLPASAKINVVYNGIDLGKFDPALDKRPFCQAFNIPPDAPVVGMVGRLRPWKGQGHFLKMAAHIAAQRPDVYFLIVGGATFGVDESYAQQLKNLAATLQIADRVVFTGPSENVPQALTALDIFVHPGDPEPFGLVNIEAMAMAKPIVAFAHGALPEIVVAEKTGLLLTPYDTNALATAVLSLLHDPHRRKMMGENGRLRVKTNFSIQQTASQIETIYTDILGKSPHQ